MAVSRAGRIERRKQTIARIRRPNLDRFYNVNLGGVLPGAWTFRVQLLRARGERPTALDPYVTALTWQDQVATLSGTLTLARPHGADLSLAVGSRVRTLVRWRGAWYTLWEMGVQPFDTTLPDESISVPLADDMILIERDKRDWSLRKKTHGNVSWTAEEATRYVAKTLGVPIGQVARATYHFDRIVLKHSSGLDVLRAAWQKERDATGRRFIIRLRDGRLEVIALRRNNILYVFEKQVQDALLSMVAAQSPFTVLEGRGHVGKGKDAHKVKYTEARLDIVRRFGRVTQQKDYGRVTSLADLRQQVKRDYARAIQIKRTAEITVPCVPFIRRGDGIQWVTSETGWHGPSSQAQDRSYAFTTSVTHDIAPDLQTTTLDLSQADPYVKDALRLDSELRAKARARRKKRQRGAHA